MCNKLKKKVGFFNPKYMKKDSAIRQDTRGVRRAGNGSAWAARAGKPTCRSTHINLLFGFFENLYQNLFLYM